MSCRVLAFTDTMMSLLDGSLLAGIIYFELHNKQSIQNFWYTTFTYLVSSSSLWAFLQAQEAWYEFQYNQKSMLKRTTAESSIARK